MTANLPAHILAILNGEVTAITAITDTSKPHLTAKKEESEEPVHSVGVLTELPELETHSLSGDNVVWED